MADHFPLALGPALAQEEEEEAEEATIVVKNTFVEMKEAPRLAHMRTRSEPTNLRPARPARPADSPSQLSTDASESDDTGSDAESPPAEEAPSGPAGKPSLATAFQRMSDGTAAVREPRGDEDGASPVVCRQVTFVATPSTVGQRTPAARGVSFFDQDASNSVGQEDEEEEEEEGDQHEDSDREDDGPPVTAWKTVTTAGRRTPESSPRVWVTKQVSFAPETEVVQFYEPSPSSPTQVPAEATQPSSPSPTQVPSEALCSVGPRPHTPLSPEAWCFGSSKSRTPLRSEARPWTPMFAPAPASAASSFSSPSSPSGSPADKAAPRMRLDAGVPAVLPVEKEENSGKEVKQERRARLASPPPPPPAHDVAAPGAARCIAPADAVERVRAALAGHAGAVVCVEAKESHRGWNITAYVHAKLLQGYRTTLLSAAQQALLSSTLQPSPADTADEEQFAGGVCLLGCAASPFAPMALGFGCAVADLPKGVCWSSFAKGFCDRPGSCQGQHPKAQVGINIMLKPARR